MSFAHALLTEDAVTLWLMGIHGRFPVKGGRWMRPDHETIYGLDETRWVQKASDLSDDEKADLVLQIVRWTIPDNWYWNHYFAKYPKMRKSTYLKDLGKAPEWVISERKKRNKMA
ncbi:MAG: hypothetical protein L7T84_14100 [Akkermansiaceae bacterium]|nr:hypothetical protein [Akkermansiaceae bacterium]